MKGINVNIVDRVLRDIEYIDNNGLEYWYASDLNLRELLIRQ